ncbi:bifunctional adenosylcobinamide kinase/adenosylcobinamide-phosphate guanylyltransferase [Pseudoalteromonas sp. MMG022]|uniref:bifunctional adenosylcobinamide kinase/adenosylcobinamide-phosphate guanylyltransferase n=1 Tax=Pseudoalteromonas sp. MMG022 TaxID=2909978 RepID=UPI001F01AE07|nr:bifunctional adenosylcobinamide kinase/adenosylcobinamide-phosphate guanylyltransferase [Pseudoalteromonas sp. MMG022]MCF6436094.1 bifunctional adenosylcobinamide kinase/adenosylcobinamide-phosphate guanylyltransferase [Pseudoalteromonas sp. MMG022]
MSKEVQLILGGARSGKSALAEHKANTLLTSGKVEQIVYLATAQAKDDEMLSRIAHHQARRDEQWQLIEEPWLVPEQLMAQPSRCCVLVDCLTLWLTYGLCEKGLAEYLAKKQQLLAALQGTLADVIMVSNEVGHGIVPMGELNREFVDQSGWLHQDIANIATHVEFVMAGCSLRLK